MSSVEKKKAYTKSFQGKPWVNKTFYNENMILFDASND